MIVCAFGCGKSLDETTEQAALVDWEQLTVTATRNGGSEHLLSVMVCPEDAPAPGAVVLSKAPQPVSVSSADASSSPAS